MRIGIDISQIAHEGTGVSKYVREMVREILKADTANEYILFGTSLRKRNIFYSYFNSLEKSQNVTLVTYPIPPTLLDFLWNILHIIPVEWLIGNVDVFWSSDWTQPPLAKAKGITTIHDLSILRFPESFHSKILSVQKRRLVLAKKVCEVFLCDSKATMNDCIKFLHIPESKLKVVYPGYSL